MKSEIEKVCDRVVSGPESLPMRSPRFLGGPERMIHLVREGFMIRSRSWESDPRFRSLQRSLSVATGILLS